MKQLTAPDYHDFEKEKDYVGEYVEQFLRPKDDDKDKTKKKGDLIGYVFQDAKGSKEIVGNSYLVEKSMKEIKKGDIVGFRFLGQDKNTKGQKFNNFDIWQFDDWKEAERFYSEEEK
jgi:hypothetical protein